LKKMFEQPAFLDGAMHAPWRYWIPQICLYQGSGWIAVGMPVTGHPPHRSQRAQLTHWAPTLGV